MKMNVHTVWFSTMICVAMATFSCKGPTPPAQGGPVPVNLDTVTMQNTVYHDVYPGNIIAQNEVELRSEVNGFITEIYFQEGSYVHKGQKLYEIEQSKYSSAYAQAEANLKIAKSNL